MNKIEGVSMSADVILERGDGATGERAVCTLVKLAEETEEVVVSLRLPAMIITGTRRTIQDALYPLTTLIEEVTWAAKYGWRVGEKEKP
jgi:hypothetical protein